jgi:hypothetical protein
VPTARAYLQELQLSVVRPIYRPGATRMNSIGPMLQGICVGSCIPFKVASQAAVNDASLLLKLVKTRVESSCYMSPFISRILVARAWTTTIPVDKMAKWLTWKYLPVPSLLLILES